jgi:hypothetical protein
MPNAIKYKTDNLTGSISTGNVALGVNESVIGPTETTGWYNGLTPSPSQYVIYEVAESGVPKIYQPSDDTQLIQFARSNGATGANTGSVASVLNWATSQANIMISNNAYPGIVTNELNILMDGGFTPSYPTTGSTWYDLSGNNALGSISNFTYDGNSIGLSTTSSTIVLQNNIPIESKSEITEFSIGFTAKLKQAFDSISVVTFPTSTSYSEPTQSVAKYNNIVCTFSQSADSLAQTIYLNGEEVSNNTTTNASFNFGNAYNIGINTNNNTGVSKINSVQGYNKVLTPAEVKQNYYGGSIVTDGLVFAVDAGNLVSYESGSATTYPLTSSVNGTLINGTSFNPNFGGYWIFDGIDDYITWGDNFDLTTTNISGFVWGWANSLNSFLPWIDKLSSNGNYRFHANGVGSLIFGIRNTANTYEQMITTNLITTNTWYYLGFTFNNSTKEGKIYLNGQLQLSNTFTINRGDTTTPLQTGYQFNNSGALNGRVATLSLYNKQLSDQEVSQNFNAQRSRFGI